MARRVFFSFEYAHDVSRAMVVRNSWVTQDREAAGFVDAAAFEEVKKGGDTAIKRWTRDQLHGTSVTVVLVGSHTCDSLSIIIINPGLDSRARTALEHMLESVVSARGKVLRTNFSATSRVTRATKLTQAASRHSYRWCSPPTRGSATTFAVGDGRCVTVLKLGVSLFSPKWQRSS